MSLRGGRLTVGAAPKLEFNDGSRIFTAAAEKRKDVLARARSGRDRRHFSMQDFYEIERVSSVIVSAWKGRSDGRSRAEDVGTIMKVALQFPEEFLNDAADVIWLLEDRMMTLHSFAEPPLLFILGDTAYGSCCVDEIAAEHLNADVVVHYGNSCLSRTNKIPFMFVFGRMFMSVKDATEEVSGAIERAKEEGSIGRGIILIYDVLYHYAIRDFKRELEGRFQVPILLGSLQDGDDLVMREASSVQGKGGESACGGDCGSGGTCGGEGGAEGGGGAQDPAASASLSSVPSQPCGSSCEGGSCGGGGAQDPASSSVPSQPCGSSCEGGVCGGGVGEGPLSSGNDGSSSRDADADASVSSDALTSASSTNLGGLSIDVASASDLSKYTVLYVGGSNKKQTINIVMKCTSLDVQNQWVYDPQLDKGKRFEGDAAKMCRRDLNRRFFLIQKAKQVRLPRPWRRADRSRVLLHSLALSYTSPCSSGFRDWYSSSNRRRFKVQKRNRKGSQSNCRLWEIELRLCRWES